MTASAQIKVAMVTGHHEYDVVAFQQMLRSISDVDFYPQHLEDFCIDEAEARFAYDVVAFYNYQQETPQGDDYFSRTYREPLEGLGRPSQGVFILHHALTAFPHWPYWWELCGMGDTTRALRPGPVSRTDQRLRIEDADDTHPVTAGRQAWDMVDEVYNFPDAMEGSHILLTTEHPECMRTIAWTRRHRQSRVFCLQSGHDNQTFADPSFRKIVERGVMWAAGRI